jgi:glycosyltransferase involved in cell wall biosynthesis
LLTRFSIEWIPANPRLKRYDFSFQAVRRAQALGADLVYTWPPQAALIALVYHLPVLLELHGPPEGRLGPLVFRLILNQPGKKRFLPITLALAHVLERQFNRRFMPGEVVVAPNGVDLERYQDLPAPEEARQQLGLPEVLTVGYTGHLYPGRGMGLLVELAQRFPQIRFLWVGGRTEDVESWKAKLVERKVENITLTGFIENQRLPLFQAAADILLMPYERQIAGSGGGNSAEYCSPMKMFEYMACGRAILSSDLPVIHEVLNETNAVLVPPEDPNAWSQALSILCADREKRLALGERARQDVQRYAWVERARKALEGFIG